MGEIGAARATARLRAMPHTLRLRLVFWYGLLLTITLVAFGTLIFLLASNALNQSVITNTRVVGHAALLDVERQLQPNPPYLPLNPDLHDIDLYRTPIVFALLTPDGQVVYSSNGSQLSMLPRNGAAWNAALRRQEAWYTTEVNGDRLYVGVLPICQPKTANTLPAEVSATAVPACQGPLVGLLLVAKSFNDVDNILLLLKTLLVVASAVILIGALAGGWFIVSHILRPLEDVVATARAIKEATARGTRIGDLSLRVPRPRRHDEIGLVIDSFNAMLSDLEHAVRAQRRFIADASHELRAPLTTIQGNLAFLQRHIDELPPEERRTMLCDAHSETLRLARLVDDLLLLARADASFARRNAEEEIAAGSNGRRALPPVVELDRVVLHLIRQLRLRLQAEDSPLKLEIGHIEPVRVRGEEEQLRRLMLILLDNALKYTPAESEQQPGRVVVSLERIGNEALLRVSDTGIGIDPADLPHIFERFYRADRARQRPGTGLGLAIAQTLVEQFGGRIGAESVPGEGSTFSVWLPVATPGSQ
ncbi:sensor histidine kinase [Thermogemmatispora sp.]|uniref:sensor histidine kinase n=1 Tax=Thermogemmatispora sp. TaxID=1968838 RepID=UPI001D3F342B|nr:HAMP domain-containing sensor histidine kinase [Thermogemmatispora sp.]MBX5451336.1 HAMP domain-containing histidine kinase [Thermogemmatispora sp.]